MEWLRVEWLRVEWLKPMGNYRGNVDRIMADAAKIVQRLREGNTCIRTLKKEYRCGYPIVMRAIFSKISKGQWAKIRHEKLARSGIKTRFKKGIVSWNKGWKGLHLSRASEFKKGHLPANYKKLGTVTIRKDRAGPVRFIAVAGPTPQQHKWIPYAIYLWEKENGPVPAGFLVRHMDGDRLNDDLSNLKIVDRREHIAIMRANNPNWRKKANRSLKKTVRIRRAKKKKAAREALKQKEYELKLQRKSEAEAGMREHIERGLKELRAPVRTWWECIGCGCDFDGEPPHICPKCNGLRFSLIEQRKIA